MWVESTEPEGLGARTSQDAENPGSWTTGDEDYAFTRIEEPIGANGFESGTGCPFAATLVPICPTPEP